MPIFYSGANKAPKWSQIKYFELIPLGQNESCHIMPKHEKEMLIVGRGECLVETEEKIALCRNGYDPSFGHIVVDELQHLRNEPFRDRELQGKVFQVKQDTAVMIADAEKPVKITGIWDDTMVIRISGEWSDGYVGAGTFVIIPSEKPLNGGDPDETGLKINTTSDNHYHDMDEYWIVFEGHATFVSEGLTYEVGPGACLATGKGHHHYIPFVHGPIKAAYFEGSLEGEKRMGHLHNHSDGNAEPDLNRLR